MKIQTDAMFLTAESKDYDFNGNKGTSHKVRVSIEGEVFALKADSSDIEALKEFESGEQGVLVADLVSPKERIQMIFKSFETQ